MFLYLPITILEIARFKKNCFARVMSFNMWKYVTFMTFFEGYITTVLEDAIVYSKHAGKKDVDADDVQLAIQSRLDHSYTNPPPREVVCFCDIHLFHV